MPARNHNNNKSLPYTLMRLSVLRSLYCDSRASTSLSERDENKSWGLGCLFSGEKEFGQVKHLLPNKLRITLDECSASATAKVTFFGRIWCPSWDGYLATQLYAEHSFHSIVFRSQSNQCLSFGHLVGAFQMDDRILVAVELLQRMTVISPLTEIATPLQATGVLQIHDWEILNDIQPVSPVIIVARRSAEQCWVATSIYS